MTKKETELKRKAQKEYCSKGTPNFAEFGTDVDGKCIYCHTNIWKHISLEKASNKLITGCPVCHRSYCD